MISTKYILGTKTLNKGTDTLRKDAGGALGGRRWLHWLAGGLALLASAAQAGPTVTDIEFASRPGSKFEIRLDFDQAPPEAKAYTIEKPARLAIDFPDTSSALESKRFSLPYGNATGVVVLEALDRVNRELGTTLVVITHNAAISRMADRVLSLADGRIVSEQRNEVRISAQELEW